MLTEKTNIFFIEGTAGRLESLLEAPKTPANFTEQRLAVICHPHPLFGGTMHNKVVTTAARAFSDKGITALRFNYRGVGQSEGRYDEGRGETEDILSVIRWAKQQYPALQLWLLGFSFGAYTSLNAADTLRKKASVRLQQLITIAPAVNHADFTGLYPDCAWFVIQGEKDEVVSATEVARWVNTLSPAPVFITVPETSHFFDGKLMILRQLLNDNLLC